MKGCKKGGNGKGMISSVCILRDDTKDRGLAYEPGNNSKVLTSQHALDTKIVM